MSHDTWVTRIAARHTERLLILVATIAIAVGYESIALSQQPGHLSLAAIYPAIGFLVVMAICHVIVGVFAPYAEQVFLPTAGLLNGLGILMIHRLDLARPTHSALPALAMNQTILSLLALVVFAVVIIGVRNYAAMSNYAYLTGLVALVLLILPVVWPFGHPPGAVNAKIWISVGRFSLQPGEFAKILFIVFFAKLLIDKNTLFSIAGTKKFGIVFPRWRDIAQILVIWFIAMAVMVIENDFGPVLLLFGTVLVMLYLTTGRISWIAIGAALIAAGAPILYEMSPKIQDRVKNAWDPLAHYATPAGYQPSQALFSWASGGLTGSGMGVGYPQLVPVAHSDYIMSAFGEETGLIGVAAIILGYAVIVTAGLITALKARDRFGKLVAAGLSVTIMIQVFTVVGGTSSLLPMTGLTTPFVSAGGSSLMANYLLLAILMKISSAAGQPERQAEEVAA